MGKASGTRRTSSPAGSTSTCAPRARPRRRTPAPPQEGRPLLRHLPHLAADPRGAHRQPRAGGLGPGLAAGQPHLAAQRAPLRRPAGQGQGADGAAVRRRAGEAVAPELRRAAAGRSPSATSTTQTNDRRATASRRPTRCRASECLKDVVARVLPWWHDSVVPQLRAGRTVLVVAHGNSLRALIKHLEHISDADIVELNVPTGMPRLYRFNDELDARRDAPLPRRGRRQGRRRGREEADRVRSETRPKGGRRTPSAPVVTTPGWRRRASPSSRAELARGRCGAGPTRCGPRRAATSRGAGQPRAPRPG